MKKKYIKIYGIHDAIVLVNMATEVKGDVTISRGKYAVDAKSILGVMALDVSSGVTIEYPISAKEFDEYVSQFEITLKGEN